MWLCLPVRNDSAERAFSDVKRKKKDFLSSNLNLRLNAVCLMFMEKAYRSWRLQILLLQNWYRYEILLYCANLLCFRISKYTVYLLFQTALRSYPGHFQISCGSQRLGTVIRRLRKFNIDYTPRPQSKWIWRWWWNNRTNFSKQFQWRTPITNIIHDAKLFLTCCCTILWSKIFDLLRCPKFHYHVHEKPPLDFILRQTDNQIYTITAPYPRLRLGLHSVLHFVVTKVFSEMNCADGLLFSPGARKQRSYATVGFSTSHISMECRQQWKQPVTEGAFCFQQFLITTPTRKPIHFTDCR